MAIRAQLAESQQDLEQERKTSQAAKGEATGIDPWEAKRFKDALEASRQTEVRLQEEIEAVRAELETCKASLSEREACQDIDGQDGGKVNRDAASALTGCMHELSVLVRSIKMQVEGAGSAMDILLRDEGRVCEGEEKHLLEALLCESPQSQRSAGLPGKGIASVARKMRSDLEILRDMISNQSAEDAAGDCVIS